MLGCEVVHGNHMHGTCGHPRPLYQLQYWQATQQVMFGLILVIQKEVWGTKWWKVLELYVCSLGPRNFDS